MANSGADAAITVTKDIGCSKPECFDQLRQVIGYLFVRQRARSISSDRVPCYRQQ
jgi:hypothetical protein